MAVFNEILVGRYNRLLQKFFGMKGPPPTPQLASELIPVFPVFHGRENRFLESWNTFGARAAQAAVTAQDTVARLNNPKTSNVIAVVESITVAMGVANSDLVMEFSNVASGNLASTYTPASFDNRINPQGVGTNGASLTLSSANNIGQGTHVLFNETVLATAGNLSNEFINYENQEIQLLPGSDLQFRTITLNTSLFVNMRWRERALEESETTG